MGEDGAVEVEREAAEEDHEHWHPPEIFRKRGQETLLTEAVAEDGEGDVAADVEDDDEGDEDCRDAWSAADPAWWMVG